MSRSAFTDRDESGVIARGARSPEELLTTYAGTLARILLEECQAPDALSVVQAGLAARPDDPELHVLAGRAWFMMGELLRAQRALTHAMRLSPDDLDPYIWSARVLLRRGDPVRAMRVLRRAFPLDPGNETLLELYARAQLAQLSDGG